MIMLAVSAACKNQPLVIERAIERGWCNVDGELVAFKLSSDLHIDTFRVVWNRVKITDENFDYRVELGSAPTPIETLVKKTFKLKGE